MHNTAKEEVHQRKSGQPSGLQMGEKAFYLCFIFGMGSGESARLFVNWLCIDELIYFQVRTKITITAIVIFLSGKNDPHRGSGMLSPVNASNLLLRANSSPASFLVGIID